MRLSTSRQCFKTLLFLFSQTSIFDAWFLLGLLQSLHFSVGLINYMARLRTYYLPLLHHQSPQRSPCWGLRTLSRQLEKNVNFLCHTPLTTCL
ncbi:hypothetical protein F5887DRAFT_935509 [Amanita rubescens]|nr:hypothetical protein F5887DRAFT_935509 [Amanita rubescens]